MEQEQNNNNTEQNQQKTEEEEKKVVVCALYKFIRFPEYKEYQPELLEFMKQNGIFGTLILADEGINGTVASSRQGIDALIKFLNSQKTLNPVDFKESYTHNMPFKQTKTKVKKEICTLGVEGINPIDSVGTYVDPKEWNDIISDPETILIDTRNDYEYKIGTFKGAVLPPIHSFAEFPDFIKKNYDPKKHKKIAQFCTGGIRCEKSTAFMKSLGYDEVYHLKGGILKYMENVPKEQSLWEGECYVFDERISVDHDLQPGKTKPFFTGRIKKENEQQQQQQEEQKIEQNMEIEQQ